MVDDCFQFCFSFSEVFWIFHILFHSNVRVFYFWEEKHINFYQLFMLFLLYFQYVVVNTQKDIGLLYSMIFKINSVFKISSLCCFVNMLEISLSSLTKLFFKEIYFSWHISIAPPQLQLLTSITNELPFKNSL